jgi:hypothetical protein
MHAAPRTCWRRSTRGSLLEKSREMDDRKFFIQKMTQTAFLKAKEEFSNNVWTPSDELCMPEAAEVAVLCQGWLIISESFLPPPGRAAPGEGQPEAAHISGLLESCLPTLGCAAPGEGQPEAAQYQGGLTTASEELCLPTGCAAWRRSRLPETSREMDDRNFFVYKMTQTAFLKAKEEFNNNVRTPSDELCMSEAAEVAALCQGWLMISESFLPPPGCAAPGEGQTEAAHISGPLESCLPTLGRAAHGEGQPEAAQYQGGLTTASEELCLPTGCAAWRRSRLPETSREMDDRGFFVYNSVRTPLDEWCTPEAAEVAVLCQGWLIISESCLPPPGRAAPREGQPEVAHMGGLLESCLPTLGRAAPGESQPEAAQYQGGLTMALEELCLPTGCAAWRRSRLLETSREMDDRNFFIHNMTQTAFFKAKRELNNNLRKPSDELYMREAAVPCQAGLMVASESCLPPGCGALREAQYQGGLRMAAEKLCMLPPGHAGGGQPEAAQYQGGLKMAMEESCMPLGCAALVPVAWRRSWLPGTSREMDDRKFFIHNMTQTVFLKAKEEFNNSRTPLEELCMPEAAVLCQGWLMISESCLPPPGRAVPGEVNQRLLIWVGCWSCAHQPWRHGGGASCWKNQGRWMTGNFSFARGHKWPF